MNILVYSWRDPLHPLAGGAEQVMHEHMKGWIEAGHSVTLFSSAIKQVPSRQELDKVKIIRRGSQYLSVHLLAFFWYFLGKHGKYDLVVDQFHGLPFFTPLYVRVPRLAVIQELTRKVWFRYPLPYGLNYILGTLGFILEPLFFLLYRNIPFMTGSNSAKDELQSMGIKSKNITVVPHGVIIQAPKEHYKKEKIPTVIFLGALASDKGIEDAIETFGLLNAKGEYQFWIVGKGEEKYFQQLKKKVRDLGISNKTIFFGYVSQEKKFELLQRAHVMINPSIREGWGLVNIEANAMGTPVIAYSSPGLVDSVTHGLSGYLCAINSPDEMASKVIRLIENDREYKKLQNGSIKWSNNFSWDKSKKLSLDLINKITNG